jgi:hypothetical protein
MAKKLKWGTIENLDNLIDDYFDQTKINGLAPNIAGLCLHLDIGKDTWIYYNQERWRTHRRSEEEVRIINDKEDTEDRAGNAAFQEWEEVSPKLWIVEEFSQNNRSENDAIKARVSESIKKAALKIEAYTMNTVLTSKTPVGAIFYAKSALGYREADAVAQQQQQSLPTKIIIEVLPAIAKAAQIASKD